METIIEEIVVTIRKPSCSKILELFSLATEKTNRLDIKSTVELATAEIMASAVGENNAARYDIVSSFVVTMLQIVTGEKNYIVLQTDLASSLQPTTLSQVSLLLSHFFSLKR